ncbi:membrane-bound alpha-1,6 mannosyltransferase initiation-specific [Spathaspora passalidarum NRRL Y-27907]|uniref:Membrane-bound alpha-1,6 mannosyltransferase initiation-specific n=1 Tax=Spathaspora passalidarum (strain NRRL Y-27907 / 11-Y1) TaxID=619300 RepID=G3AUD0_SPAPN|nr:membrane-bound alpha-1,6 mannosyltransferase initiation-specific [Spathaspora passalidarum NRRL Y-27907]EGW30506.1 membrane-bound alpha-1,6 mannosyltransferase initiation-specific [Spathaspora passalidarum NRRL Y-27907]
MVKFLQTVGQIGPRNTRILAVVSGAILFFYVFAFHFGGELPNVSAKSYSQAVSPKEQFLKEIQEQPLYRLTGFNLQPSNPGRIPYNTTVLKQLHNKVTYDPSEPIPKKVWQMWKVPLEHPEFPAEYRKYHQTWLDNSPNYEHIFRTNAEYDKLVNELYADIPEVLHAYNILPQTILKCDFSRYLLLYLYGGIYSDLDTILWKPMDIWITNQTTYLNRPLDPGIIVGIENDVGARINNWTILSKKGHPMIAEMINQITEHTLWREKTGQLNAIFKSVGDNVLDWTGPGRFTDLTFKYLNNVLQTDFDHFETIIDYKYLENIRLPFILSDIMVLPINSMRADQKPEEDPLAYISHKFAGVWKTQQQKEDDREDKP